MSFDHITYALCSGGGGMPVIELTTLPTLDGAPLTAEEAAQVESALASGIALVCFPMEVAASPIICKRIEADGMIAFVGNIFANGSMNMFILGDMGDGYMIVIA